MQENPQLFQEDVSLAGKISRVLVTGGAGFIGSNIVDHLIREGRQVWVLDDLSTGSLDNLATHTGKGSVNVVQGDIGDRALVSELMGNVEAVIHQAALLDHETCLRNPQLADQVNHQGTSVLLEEALKHGDSTLRLRFISGSIR